MSEAQLLPWLLEQTRQLRAAHMADRMPHALLIHEDPGAGGEWLAFWVAQLLLCQHAERAPCGSCHACRRVAAGQHPDVLVVCAAEESRQLKIEQIRELSSELSLTSHQGGYKVGIVTPADLMNRFAANALLKTLEEPSPRTVLILVATQPSRLPATILSRCQRIRVPAPARAEAVRWLESQRGAADWNAVLEVLGDAPLAAATADSAAIVQLGADTRRGLEDSARGAADPVALAERWSRSEPALRLRCFETWLTKRIHEGCAETPFLTEVGAGAYLQAPQTVLNIRLLFELLDGVRNLKSALDTPINRGLALEGLLRRLAPMTR